MIAFFASFLVEDIEYALLCLMLKNINLFSTSNNTFYANDINRIMCDKSSFQCHNRYVCAELQKIRMHIHNVKKRYSNVWQMWFRVSITMRGSFDATYSIFHLLMYMYIDCSKWWWSSNLLLFWFKKQHKMKKENSIIKRRESITKKYIYKWMDHQWQ